MKEAMRKLNSESSSEMHDSHPLEPRPADHGKKNSRRSSRRQGGRADSRKLSDHEASLLAMAKSFLQQQKRYLQERSELLQHARDQWQLNFSNAGENQSDGERQLMGFVKATLEEQTRRLNNEVRQLRKLKDQVRSMESGRAQVRDITPDVMDMRARAAATVGSPIFSPLGAMEAAPGDGRAGGGLFGRSPGGLADEPLAGWQPGLGSWDHRLRAHQPPAWNGASSDYILSKMYGERDAVRSLMTSYSSWLENMKNTIPTARPPQLHIPHQSVSPPHGSSPQGHLGAAMHPSSISLNHQGPFSPDGGDGALHLGLNGDNELVISLRPREA